MILDTTTRKLQIVLTGAKTTLDMPVVVDWVDNTTTTFTPGVTPTTTNGIGLVDILAAPSASTQRKVNGLTINNIDTATKTVQVLLNDNGTSYQLQSQLLQVGDILCYTDSRGWYTKDSNGNIKGFGPTGATGTSGIQGLSGTIGFDGTDGEDTWPIPSTFQIAPVESAGPAFSAYLPTANQSITSGVLTKVALSAEEFDTTTAFDSVTNYRFLPLVSGYYQVNAGVSISGAIGTASSIIIYKNGSAFKEGAGSTASATAVQLDASAIIYLNGSSDYIELFCSYTGTTPVIIFGSNNTYFQASLLPGIAGASGGGYTGNSMVRLNTANGYGSTNTVIRRFTNTVTNQGTDITYADSATLGATFTINTGGVYAISYSDSFNVAQQIGVSLNSNQLTTGLADITVTNIVCIAVTSGTNFASCVSNSIRLSQGDIIRAHTAGDPTGAKTSETLFTITRIV